MVRKYRRGLRVTSALDGSACHPSPSSCNTTIYSLSQRVIFPFLPLESSNVVIHHAPTPLQQTFTLMGEGDCSNSYFVRFFPPFAFPFFVFIFVSWWKKAWKFSGIMPDILLSFNTVSSQNVSISKQWECCPQEGPTIDTDYFRVVSLVHGQDKTFSYVFRSCRIKRFLFTELFRQDTRTCVLRCSVFCRYCVECIGVHITSSTLNLRSLTFM